MPGNIIVHSITYNQPGASDPAVVTALQRIWMLLETVRKDFEVPSQPREIVGTLVTSINSISTAVFDYVKDKKPRFTFICQVLGVWSFQPRSMCSFSAMRLI